MCQAYPNIINLSHYAAESAREQYEAIPVIWLATQTGKMGSPVLISRKKKIAWSELTKFVIFLQCRQWSRKKGKKKINI